MLETVVLFAFGFCLLLKGADILTDAASDLAKKFKISNFMIGLLVVGIGTSIPEFIVTVLSNIHGSEKIGLGAVIGSNSFNIMIILGISAAISPLILTKKQVWHHLVLNLLAVLSVVAVLLLSVRPGASFLGQQFELSRAAGLLLILLFITWIIYLKKINQNSPAENEEKNINMRPGVFDLILLVAGLVGVVIGGEWVTESSIEIARYFNLKESLIGLTVVGIGTSLPELFASAVAAYKKNYGIAVGNVIGSNIFDFLMILGVAAFMKPIPVASDLILDLVFTLAVSIILFVSVFIGKKYAIKRWQGIVFILIYILYFAYLVKFH